MSDTHLAAIRQAVREGEQDRAGILVQQALEAGLAPLEVMKGGVVAGIQEAGELWQANQFFLPDVILAADAFKAAMRPLEPLLQDSGESMHAKKIVIGVVHGDVHDLGKSLVNAMFTSAGFEVHDLGIDVPLEKFIESVQAYKPAILGLGAYMTTTMLQIKAVIAELEKRGLRQSVQVMVGGVPTSQAFADEVGADAWGKDALDATRKALELLGV